MILGGYEMIFPGDISKMPYLTHGKAEQLMLRTGQEKKEKAGWQPARLDLHVREARV